MSTDARSAVAQLRAVWNELNLASVKPVALAWATRMAAAITCAEKALQQQPMPRPALRQTRTYVELGLSLPAYGEIRQKLREAGYDHAFMDDGAIDLHGLAAVVDPAAEPHGTIAIDAVVPPTYKRPQVDAGAVRRCDEHPGYDSADCPRCAHGVGGTDGR